MLLNIMYIDFWMRNLRYLCTKHESLCNVTSKQCICTLGGNYTAAVGGTVVVCYRLPHVFERPDDRLDHYWGISRSGRLLPHYSTTFVNSTHEQSSLCSVSLNLYVGSVSNFVSVCLCRSHWPRCLKRGSAVARLLELWVRIQLG
jgi:hypothetical protein